MDEAIQNIPRQPSAVIATLARQAAIKAVKRQLQAQGIKLTNMSHREIVILAEEYLAQHRQTLLAHAWELVCSAPTLRVLYDQEQRELIRGFSLLPPFVIPALNLKCTRASRRLALRFAVRLVAHSAIVVAFDCV